MRYRMTRLWIGLVPLVWTLQAAGAPASLDDLLQDVLKQREVQKQENVARERRFLEAREQQQDILAAAQAALVREQARSDALRVEYEQNQATIAVQSEALSQATGDLGELHGVSRQIAGDLKGVVAGSLYSAQEPKRGEGLQTLADSKELPSIQALEWLWHVALSEMVESSKVVRFDAKIAATDGTEQEAKVTRIGAFNLISGGQYLRYLADTDQIVMPTGQPSDRYVKLAEALEKSTEGVHMMAVDPTRGALLALLMQRPGFVERIQQAGAIGYVILALGAAALGVVIERFVVLGRVRRRMRQQKAAHLPRTDNPLGRLRIIERDNPGDDAEILGLKLDQGVLQEAPRLRRLLPALAVCATAAPLLGLLGTVAGMIETFQAMTLFGAGDPKLVAGGISLALVATELGLLVAIPILVGSTAPATGSCTRSTRRWRPSWRAARPMPPLADVWDRAQVLLEQGGIIMPYILALSVLMWALILERLWFFWRVQPQVLADARAVWEARAERRSRPARRLREHQVAALYAAGRRALPAIRTLITVLPLMGLLGTVSGMIHTFEVITAFGGANRRGIAAGISEALVATLTGLITALSGLYFSVHLEARARRIPAEAETLLRAD
ncbi:MAG: hypothetical protein USCGTAYLOR_01707 [Chromatiales bacterium USCg_Taylor]|nr:MAG: hypothetical protein USCGTAYLOR_01707 [Chromatiales bacterium USCg_Taylor]